jgi:hypothetical protein
MNLLYIDVENLVHKYEHNLKLVQVLEEMRYKFKYRAVVKEINNRWQFCRSFGSRIGIGLAHALARAHSS